MSKSDALAFKVQDISVFLAVAEYQSVTKAAEFLFFAPSQVSKIIKKLETLWGIELFTRDNHSMVLTPPGEHLYRTLSETPQEVKRALAEAEYIRDGTGFVRIGCPSLSLPSDLFAPVIKAYVGVDPNTTISIECSDSLPPLRKKLISGEVDIIYTTDLDLFPLPEPLMWQPVKNLTVSIILNKAHRLASRPQVTLEDLAEEQFVVVRPEFADRESYVMGLCKEHGFVPRVTKYVPNIYSLMMEIGISSKYVCIDSAKGFMNDTELRFWDIPDFHGQMGFACRKDAPSAVLNFFNFITEFFEEANNFKA